MKTQLSKPVRDRASYTEEYKEQALQLWRASGRSAAKVATELGIRPPLLYRWARAERFPATSPPGQKRERSVEALEAEIRRLRAENAKLLEQRTVTRGPRGQSLLSTLEKQVETLSRGHLPRLRPKPKCG